MAVLQQLPYTPRVESTLTQPTGKEQRRSGINVRNLQKGPTMIERQELYCHNCGGYVQFDMDLSINGNHVLTCPKCGHQHCRVVKDGVITDIRWDQRNNNSTTNAMYITPSSITYSTQSTFNTYTSGANYVVNPSNYVTMTVPTTPTNQGTDRNGRYYLYGAWMNVTSTT